MTALADRLRGSVIPAVPVPFKPDGRIDAAAQRTYARWMAQQAVGGVAVWAHTGRGLWLTDAQRNDVLACWRNALGTTPIVCGVGIPRGAKLPGEAASRAKRARDVTVSMAELAKQGGASAVLVHPPAVLRDLPNWEASVLEYHTAIAAVGLPVIVFYLYEAAGGIAYSTDLIGRLLHLDGVIGIKLATLDSVMTFQDVGAVVQSQGDPLFITGEDRFLGYSLMLGADAGLIGIAAACTDEIAALFNAWFARDLERFALASAAVDRFGRATFRQPVEGYVQRLLWALEADGIIEPGAHDPFGPGLSAADRCTVVDAVRALRSR